MAFMIRSKNTEVKPFLLHLFGMVSLSFVIEVDMAPLLFFRIYWLEGSRHLENATVGTCTHFHSKILCENDGRDRYQHIQPETEFHFLPER